MNKADKVNLTNRMKRTLWLSYWNKMRQDISAEIEHRVGEEFRQRCLFFHTFDKTAEALIAPIENQLIALLRDSLNVETR